MNPKKRILILVSMILITFLCLNAVLFAARQYMPDIYGTGNQIQVIQSKSGVVTWLEKYWPYIGFAISESLAFIPGKANGIIHAALKIGKLIFKR